MYFASEFGPTCFQGDIPIATTDPRVIGYNSVRRTLGLLGFALPVTLFLFGRSLNDNKQPSISDFYHTAMGDVLVGTLCAIGIFLISYKGYPRGDKWFGDAWVSTLAGLGAIGVALYPTGYKYGSLCDLDPCYVSGFTAHKEYVHLISAGTFFVCLAIFCLVLFPQGNRAEISKARKTAENATYRICGIVLLVAIAGLVYVSVFSSATLPLFGIPDPVFWFESMGIIAFSVSWLTKGKIIAGVRSLMPGAPQI